MSALWLETILNRLKRKLVGSPASLHAAKNFIRTDAAIPSIEKHSGHETGGRVMAIDGLRAVAMLMVFVYHTWEFGDAPAMRLGPISLGHIINGFSAGVDLFMVLSGFCLFWPLARGSLLAADWDNRDFARRRLRRIFPAYLGSMVFVSLLPNFLVCIFKLAHIQAKWQEVPSVWQYLTHLTFTHTLFPGTWSGIQGVYWSLGLEAQLYVVFPLVVWGFSRLGIRVLIPMVALSLVYRAIGAIVLKDSSWLTQFLFSITFLGRWMEFAAGMFAAWMVARRWTSPFNAVQGFMLCVLAVQCYVLAMLRPEFGILSMRQVLLSVSFASLAIAMCVSRTHLRAVLENRVLIFLGMISYSIFLLHQNTMFYFGELLKKILHLDGPERFAILMTVGFAMTLVIAYASYRWLERPWASARAKAQLHEEDLPRETAKETGRTGNFFQRDMVA